jgi:opacity protein-like surface antigen
MKNNVFVLLMVMFQLAVSIECISQTFELRAGQTLFPGLYAAMRYEHPSNSEINLAGGVYIESANRYNLRYRCYGAEFLAQYSTDRENENTFSFKAGLGVNIQIDNEPWVYKDWNIPKRMNYGLVAEGGGVLNLSDAFAISVFAQQKYFFNKILGTTHFLFGLGLSYRISL